MPTEVGSRHYRRGVILGLSLAELFTVLVFLLLLVLGSYTFIVSEELAAKNHELEESDELVADQRDVLVSLVRIGRNPIQPAYPEDLIRLETTEAMRELGAENRRLRDELGLNENRRNTASDVKTNSNPPSVQDESSTVPRDQYKRQQDAIDMLTSHTADLQERLDQSPDPEQQDQLRQLQNELKNLRIQNQELVDSIDNPKKIVEVIRETEELRNTVAALEQEKENLIRERDSIADQKGQDSPCWFRVATRANGEPYERALYIFHVRIDDQSIFVKNIDAPTPQYAAQKTLLRFDRKRLNQELSNEAFFRAFVSLKEDAANRKVRSDRRCTFHVAVWDATSDTNKGRYLRAHNGVVEKIFNTYEYQHDPWPH